jgi:hypothetical protein
LGTARFSRRAHRRFGWRRRAVSGVGRSGAREVLSLPKPTLVLPLRAFEMCSSWCRQQKTGPRAAEPGTLHPTIPEGASAGRGIAAASHAMKSLLQHMALLISFHRVSESTLTKDRLPHAGRRNGTAPVVDPEVCPSRSTDRVQPQGAEQSLPLFVMPTSYLHYVERPNGKTNARVPQMVSPVLASRPRYGSQRLAPVAR